jgi:hypothetical protein
LQSNTLREVVAAKREISQPLEASMNYVFQNVDPKIFGLGAPEFERSLLLEEARSK